MVVSFDHATGFAKICRVQFALVADLWLVVDVAAVLGV